MKTEKMSLSNYIDTLQSNGKYWFTKEEALKKIKLTPIAFKNVANRTIKEKRIARAGRGFYIIVPLEYRKSGIIPTYWYIDPFMKHLKLKYYISLLTAASHYGASHQAPQQFQVMVNKKISLSKETQGNLSLFQNKNIEYISTELIKVPTGYVNMASKEVVALDLIQNYKAGGYWSHIVTVLAELAPSLSSIELVKIAEEGKYEFTTIQRLGFLLDYIGQANKSEKLNRWIHQQWNQNNINKKYIYLDPVKKPIANARNKNSKWYVILNEILEQDDL